jgi:serine/threonine protein phosphatase PrpC
MGIINFFSNLFYSLKNILAGPGRYLAALRHQATAPFRFVGSSFRQLKQIRPSRFFRLPAPISRMVEKMPGVGDFFKKRRETAEEVVEELDIPDVDGEPFRADTRKAEFSQIHLVDVNTKRRYVTHIGTDIGRSEARVKIGADNLYFLRVNPKIYNAPLLLQGKSTARIQVDGNELLPDMVDSLTVKIGSIITVNNVDYRLELFAWDILPQHTRVKASWVTHVGPIHDHNEDAVGIYQHSAGYMFVISDGVGGTAGGEIASEFTVNYMLAAFHENIRYGFDWHQVMEEAAADVNQMIRERTAMSGAISNATLTAVVVQNWDAYILHIGDTRLYHLGRDGFHRITEDHMQEVQQAGLARGETVTRKVLSRAIGKSDTVKPDKMLLRLHPGDRLLLTSDGIETIPDEELVKIVKQSDISDVPDKLMSLAYINQATDNVSVVAVEMMGEGVTKDKWRAFASHRVFVGYDPASTLNFDPGHNFRTRHPVPMRRYGCWLVVVAFLCGLFLMARVITTRNNVVENTDVEQPIATIRATRAVIFTVPPPTQTPERTIVVSPSPIVLSLEATSTLRPVPTSTLAPATGG